MPFDWKQYLELARFLENPTGTPPDQEAALRSAVSRGYFAAFCHVRDHAVAHLGFDAREQPEDHGRLRTLLKRGKMQKISERLDRLRQWRNACDYEGEVEGDLATITASAIGEADKVFVALAPPKASS